MTREELIAEIQREEQAQAIEAELARRRAGKPQAKLAEVTAEAPSFLGQQVDNAKRAIGNLGAGVSQAMLDLPAPKMLALIADLFGNKAGLPKDMRVSAAPAGLAQGVASTLPVDPNETDNERRMRKMTEGATGAAFAGLGQGPVMLGIAGASGGTGGVAGDLTRQGAGKMGISGQGLDWAELVGNILGGAPITHMLGPKQTPAKQDVRKAYKATVEGAGGDEAALLSKVKTNLWNADSAGVKTMTLADAFPEDSAIFQQGRQVANSTIENDMRAILQGRKEDLSGVVKKALDDSGPLLGSPQATADTLREAGKARLKDANARVNAPYRQLANLPDIPSGAGMTAIRDLETKIGAKGLPASNQEALAQILTALQDVNNPVIRMRPQPNPKNPLQKILKQVEEPGPNKRPESLSLNLAEAGKRMSSLSAEPGSRISAGAAQHAQREATDIVHALPPPWGPEIARSLARGQKRRADLLEPLKEGGVGKIAGMNTGATNEAPLAILNNLVSGRSAEEIATILKQLEKGQSGATTGAGRAVLENRAAMMDDTMIPNGIRPPRADSPAREALDMLINRTGGNAGKMNSKLDVVADLQARDSAPGIHTPIRMTIPQLMIRPFRTIDMMSTAQSETGRLNEIAAILAQKGGLEELQKIAMFDPNVRRQLSLLAPLLTNYSTKD